jgi:hypothetical protein
VSDTSTDQHAADLAEVLDRDRLNAVGEFLTLASKFAAGGAIAAEDGDQAMVAVRARQTVRATREALLVIATLGEPEACP